MTITLDELRKKYEELGEMIKNFEKQQEEAEFPKEGDIYYSVDTYGSVKSGRFAKGSISSPLIPLGNIFRTQEEAEFAVEQLKVIAEMKRCGGKIKTKRIVVKEYCIRFAQYFNDSETAIVIKNYAHTDARPDVWFPTEEAAQKAIDTIGEERLLKYWFCVEVEA